MLRTSILIIFLIFSALVGNLVFTKIDGEHTAAPTVKLLGPGDTPSICAERSRPYFTRNKDVLEEILRTLVDDETITNLWFDKAKDTNAWRARYVDDTADIYDDVEITEELVERYLPLISRLEGGNYYSLIAFQQGPGDRRAVAWQRSTTCGVSSFDWIKRRMRIGTPQTEKPHAAAIGFEYWLDRPSGLSICEEPVEVPEYHELCNIVLDENWTWSSRWWPEYRRNYFANE